MKLLKISILVFTVLFLVSSIVHAQTHQQLHVKRILDFEKSGAKRTAIEEGELTVGGHLPLSGFPEERLYYFSGGRGIMSLYEEAPAGDVYEVRQDISVYMTPS